MLRETGVGGEEQRGAAVAVAKMHGTALGQEVVEDGNGGRGSGQVLENAGQHHILHGSGEGHVRLLTIGVFPE